MISFNCNSIGKQPKRRQVLRFLNKYNPDILILCDTRFAPDLENTVKEEWGGPSYFSSLNSQSRGIAILFKKNLPIKICDHFSDKNGNLLGILFEYESKIILLHGVYGPNQDSPNFYATEVFSKIEEWNPHFTVFSGDWNIILDKKP